MAPVQKEPDRFFLHRAVQHQGDPVPLVHVVARQDARRQPQGPSQGRVALQVHNVHRPGPGKPQLFPGHLHQHGVPLSVFRVAEHGVVGGGPPEVLWPVPVLFLGQAEEILPAKGGVLLRIASHGYPSPIRFPSV